MLEESRAKECVRTKGDQCEQGRLEVTVKPLSLSLDNMALLWLVLFFVVYNLAKKVLAKVFYTLPKVGSTVLVTGGCQGLGRQIALLYAKAGCNIVIWDVDEKLFGKIKDEITSFNVQCIVDYVNVADKAKVSEAAGKLRAKGIAIDILINNAGIAVLKNATELSEAEYRRVMDVNYFGVVWTSLEFLSEVSKIGYVASVCSYVASDACPEYIASKHAVNGFIQSFRQELKNEKKKVSLTAIYPYKINTRLFKAYKPLKIVDLILKTQEEDHVAKVFYDSLCSGREEVFVPGHSRFIAYLCAILPSKVKDWIYLTLFSGTFANEGRVKYD